MDFTIHVQLRTSWRIRDVSQGLESQWTIDRTYVPYVTLYLCAISSSGGKSLFYFILTTSRGLSNLFPLKSNILRDILQNLRLSHPNVFYFNSTVFFFLYPQTNDLKILAHSISL